MEAGTEQRPRAKKRRTVFGKVARRKRIFARAREGWANCEIARDERLKPRLVRPIFSEVLRREIDDTSDYALLSRLAPALKVASGRRRQRDHAADEGARPARPRPRGA